MKLQVRAHAAPWRAGVEFLIQETQRDGALAIGEVGMRVLTFEELEQVRGPSLMLAYEAAQLLMDDLWNAGLRPTEGAGSAGALRATERHLNDMRRLVFDTRPAAPQPPDAS